MPTLVVSAPAYNPGGNIFLETFSLLNLNLNAGTYWLQLDHAVNPWIDPRTGSPGYVGWDDASASIPLSGATAYQHDANPGTVPFTIPYASGTFQILGPGAPPSSVPEPSSLLLLGTGLAGFWGFLRRKRLV